MTQERLSNGYRMAVNRIRNSYEQLSSRSVPEEKTAIERWQKKMISKRLKTI